MLNENFRVNDARKVPILMNIFLKYVLLICENSNVLTGPMLTINFSSIFKRI